MKQFFAFLRPWKWWKTLILASALGAIAASFRQASLGGAVVQGTLTEWRLKQQGNAAELKVKQAMADFSKLPADQQAAFLAQLSKLTDLGEIRSWYERRGEIPAAFRQLATEILISRWISVSSPSVAFLLPISNKRDRKLNPLSTEPVSGSFFKAQIYSLQNISHEIQISNKSKSAPSPAPVVG